MPHSHRMSVGAAVFCLGSNHLEEVTGCEGVPLAVEKTKLPSARRVNPSKIREEGVRYSNVNMRHNN